MGKSAGYKLNLSSEVLLTSEAGERLAQKKNIRFEVGAAAGGTIVRVQPDVIKQTLLGIGTSFTESSAFVLAHLEPAAREELMNHIFF